MPNLVAFAAMSKDPFGFDEMPWSKACEELRQWAIVHARRDEVIRKAAAAGVGQRQIQEITGVARTTIARILASPPKPPRKVPPGSRTAEDLERMTRGRR